MNQKLVTLRMHSENKHDPSADTQPARHSLGGGGNDRKEIMKKKLIQRIITGTILIAVFIFTFFHLPPYVFSGIMIAALLFILTFEWPKLAPPKKPIFWLLTPIYPVLPFFFLILLNHDPIYRNLLFFLIVLIAIFDSCSYLFGCTWGKHKLAPIISPGKTWEGFLGGIVWVTAALYGLFWYQEIIRSSWIILIFSIIFCSIALIGDLFVSLLKRRAGIKDSGTILPGHGGLLDRLDAILFSAYFWYLFREEIAGLFSLIART